MMTSEAASAQKETESPRHESAPAVTKAGLNSDLAGVTTVGFLGDVALSGRANAGVRTLAMRQMQQTHGNRFAQRAVSGRFIQRHCDCGGTCEKCRAEEEGLSTSSAESTEESTRLIQRQAVGPSTPATTESNAYSVIPSGGGAPLEEGTREFMESRFGTDFSSVLIHTDPLAAASAEALDANAYTSGRDIYFAPGKYAPETAEGQHLLAHELAHTVQQSERSLLGRLAIHAHGGILVGRADDPLEREADRVADQAMRMAEPATIQVDFGVRQYAPECREGAKPVAPELTYVVQRNGTNGRSPRIQRQSTAPRSASVATVGPPKPEIPKTDEVVRFAGIELTENPDQLREEMLHLVATGMPGRPVPSGILAPGTFLNLIMLTPRCGDQGAAGYDEECHRREVLHTKIVPVLIKVVDALHEQHKEDLEKFRTQAVANAHSVLNENKEQAETEGIKYGITSETIEKIRNRATGEGPREKVVEFQTTYGMEKESPAGKGLQDAAKVLLGRRHDIENRQKDQNSHLTWKRDPFDPKGRYLVPDDRYFEIGKEIEDKKQAYNNLRDFLSIQYPVLASFSELEKATGALETLAEKGTGPDMAALIGQEIAKRLTNIATVSNGLDDGSVNIWRQPKIVELTKRQLGVEADPVQNALIAEKVKQEQPGILQDLALLVLNIAALALAGPTGGLSLVVAAGVNVAVAASHVSEYLMQEALSGTTFDRAQAISKEEPSLFWLALEIVGTAVDVGTAASALFKTFKTLAPLVKAAKTATEGEEAVKSLQAVRTAAEAEKGAEFAEKVVAQVRNLRRGEAAALEGAGITDFEAKLLKTAGEAAEAEAAVSVGKAVKTATGEVHLSKTGHLFLCASPCMILREKYAGVFAKDGKFNAELAELEGRASKAANARKVAEASKDANALAEAEEQANKINQDVAALEKRILDANPQLVMGAQEEAAIVALRQAEAESAVTKGRLSAKPDDLEKLKPIREKPPIGADGKPLSPADPLWNDYISYFNDRLEALKAGKGVKPPLAWEEYSDFLGKFRRGTEYQKGVLKGLQEEAELAGKGKLPSGQKSPLEGMQDPVVESNVGVAGKQPGETTKFADQLIVDKATIGPGKMPKVTALSNKSRVWPEKIGAAERTSIRSQVVADAEEALTKYGGEITLRRPQEPLTELFNQTVIADPVFLVYDKAFVKTADLERLIVDSAAGVKSASGQKVIVIFR